MQIGNIFSGLLLLALSIAVFLSARSLPNPSLQLYGPGAFPALVAVLLGLCSLFLIWQGWRDRGKEPLRRSGAWMRSGRSVVRFLLVPASVAFYVLLINDLGFIVTAAVVLVVLFLSLGVRLVRAFPIALITALVAHTVFYMALRVQLPWGVLEPIRW